MERKFIILDFGSQYTWLIARSLREMGYLSTVKPFDESLSHLQKENPFGFILSGGPSSVFDKKSPRRSIQELLNIAPCLGICYGMQLMCLDLGGSVKKSPLGSYGHNEIFWEKPLIPNISCQKVWMSHGDIVEELPKGMELLAMSSQQIPSAIKGKNTLAFQFHPEVQHTQDGKKLLSFFAEEMCQAQKSESKISLYQECKSYIQNLNIQRRVLCALSGGVDSTVTACLLTRILGIQNVQCLFVNTGLLRKDEFQEVLNSYEGMGLNIKGIQAEKEFLTALKGVVDSEQKRKIIGHVFIDVFEKYKDLDVEWLAQGTLYPDVIESYSPNQSATIKSHHNVGGLPEKLNLQLVEPLRHLFKDEVRLLGKELGISSHLLNRHPFPGPGLAIRIIGEVTLEKLNILREVDQIFIQELKDNNIYNSIWQAFCVLLSCQSVGVQGDQRTFEKTVSLRAVYSKDGMTADWYPFHPDFLKEVSNKITNQVRGVNRVVYDVTSKPPATIEWE